MYLQKSFLSRLLGATWTILLIAVLLWVAVKLVSEVWIWLVAMVILIVLVRLGFWLRHWRRDKW